MVIPKLDDEPEEAITGSPNVLLSFSVYAFTLSDSEILRVSEPLSVPLVLVVTTLFDSVFVMVSEFDELSDPPSAMLMLSVAPPGMFTVSESLPLNESEPDILTLAVSLPLTPGGPNVSLPELEILKLPESVALTEPESLMVSPDGSVRLSPRASAH